MTDKERRIKREELGEELLEILKQAVGKVYAYMDEIGVPHDAINNIILSCHTGETGGAMYEAEAYRYEKEYSPRLFTIFEQGSYKKHTSHVYPYFIGDKTEDEECEA